MNEIKATEPKGLERAFNVVLLCVIIVSFLLHIAFDIYLDSKELEHRQTMIKTLDNQLKTRADAAAQKAVDRTNEIKDIIVENSNRIEAAFIERAKNKRALERKDMRELMEFMSNLPVRPPCNCCCKGKEPD